MHSVVNPRPDRPLFSLNSAYNLLRAVLALCLCQTTAILAREPDVTPEEVGLSSERLARFAVYTDAMVESGTIPGATIACPASASWRTSKRSVGPTSRSV